MRTILVAGGGGYLGVLLCQALLEAGHKVKLLDRLFFGKEKIKSLVSYPNLECVVADTRYFDAAIMKDVDAVVDLAGLSNDATAEIDPSLTTDINYRGALHVVDAALKMGVRRYVYASSASVYGYSEQGNLNEESPLNPQTEYARSKIAVERDVLPLNSPGFEPVFLRLSTLYGLAPRMRFDLAINIMTIRAWTNRVIYIMGGGDQWRPFLHVKDAVRAFILALESDGTKVAGQIFNVGDNSQNFQIKQLAGFVTDIIPNVVIHVIPDDADKRSYCLSFEKIRTQLGYAITRKAHEGIVEIKHAIESGELDPSDPTGNTLNWYKSLIEWNDRIKNVELNGKIL